MSEPFSTWQFKSSANTFDPEIILRYAIENKIQLLEVRWEMQNIKLATSEYKIRIENTISIIDDLDYHSLKIEHNNLGFLPKIDGVRLSYQFNQLCSNIDFKDRSLDITYFQYLIKTSFSANAIHRMVINAEEMCKDLKNVEINGFK
ncbi:MAG: hypothetical protein ACOCQD_01925 [archaeon]